MQLPARPTKECMANIQALGCDASNAVRCVAALIRKLDLWIENSYNNIAD